MHKSWIRAGRLTPLFTVVVTLSLTAQTTLPKVYTACYVPSSGTVYRIDKPVGTAPSAPTACGVSRKGVPDVEFSWTESVNAHGQLTGLTNDDHPQYLVGNGIRQSIDGFAVTGTLGQGKVPASGAGTRIMWYPGKAAFRAGTLSSYATYWDDASVGLYSTALGYEVKASGQASTAIGEFSTATGQSATAIGGGAQASGQAASAIGQAVIASGDFGVAIGKGTTASGTASTALGVFASTNGQEGAFVIGDYSLGGRLDATQPNQFSARFTSGYRLYSNAGMTAGVFLSGGGGAWQSISDVRKKTAFRAVDGEEILAKLAEMPVQTWQYKTQDASIRHIGPTAQDFRRAFSLGESDTTITTIDADGVALAGVKALEARTRALIAENAALHARLARIESALSNPRR